METKEIIMSDTQTAQDVDFKFANHGSVTVLTPISEAAKAWIDENIDPDAQKWAGGVVIEPRYADAVLNGISGDGFSIAAG